MVTVGPHADTNSQRTTGRLTLAFALVLVLAVVAVTIARSWDRRRTVGLVGDSITFIAASDISGSLGQAYRADVQAGIGRRADQMLPALQSVVRQKPYAVVVNLGTNDARQADSHPDWRRAFADMVAILTPTRCAILTTVYTGVGGEPDAASVASGINASLTAAAAVHRNFHIIDWNAAVQAPGGTRLLVADHVHPSHAGQLVLASLVRNALKRDCR